jgi:ketosteroid isomerase-like protein
MNWKNERATESGIHKETYQDFKKGDIQSYLSAFDENVEWQLPKN